MSRPSLAPISAGIARRERVASAAIHRADAGEDGRFQLWIDTAPRRTRDIPTARPTSRGLGKASGWYDDGSGPHSVRAHHLVVLVLHDVAVPHVPARQIELGLDPGDLARIRDDGVLVARLPPLGLPSRAVVHPLPVDHL